MTMEEPESYKKTKKKLKQIDNKKKLIKLPGLSALNLNTTYPLFGTAIVSLVGGKLYCLWSKPLRSRSKACFKLIFLTVVSGDRPIPITWKP